MSQKPTILIIEDNNNFRKHIVQLLSDQGHTLLQAKDGEEGWAQIAKNRTIDLVILDMVMPGKNGTWFVETVRSHPKYKDLPIIIFTNLSHGENLGKIIVKGISRLLTKENTSDVELTQTVKEVLMGN
jgi:two-component system cell cycle response regulator